VDLTLDACGPWPFEDHALRAVVMTNVFHHLPDVHAFFREATRCIKPGGVIAMIEPWNNRWARFVYGYMHHESFQPHAEGWRTQSHGPLSSSNSALPWIVFSRDAHLFQCQLNQWSLRRTCVMMPVCYLLAGGVSLRASVPACLYGLVRCIERLLRQTKSGMFILISMEKGL
jgi:SAM-dependent methyltransferase